MISSYTKCFKRKNIRGLYDKKLKKGYFTVPKHVHSACYNDNLVLLNLKKNEYLVLPDELKKIFICAISKHSFVMNMSSQEIRVSDHNLILPEGFAEVVAEFLGMGLLDFVDEEPDQLIFNDHTSQGVESIDWLLDTSEIRRKVKFKQWVLAYWCLVKVHFILYVFGFEWLIKVILKKKRLNASSKINKSSLADLAIVMNRAALYFPMHVKCLEWAAAMVLIAYHYNSSCFLEIGVQCNPFLAHAWVKDEHGRIVNDDMSVVDGLVVIFSSKKEN